MARDASRRLNWARIPPIATVARRLCREQTLEAEYLRVQYEVVRSKASGRIRFTDQERRRLVDAAPATATTAVHNARQSPDPTPTLDGAPAAGYSDTHCWKAGVASPR